MPFWWKIDFFSEIWAEFEKRKNPSLDICLSMLYTNFQQLLIKNNMLRGAQVNTSEIHDFGWFS